MAKNVKPDSPVTCLNEDLDDFEESLNEEGLDENLAQTQLVTIALKLTSEFCGERLDKTISTLVPEYSRSRIQQWIDDGLVLVDGKPGRSKMTMLGDEKLSIQPQAAPDAHAYAPEDLAIQVVYEDDALIVIDKPAGLVVHPAAGNWSGTLLNGLLHRWPELAMVPRAGIVHRLDKDTAGLMVIAKTLIAHTDLVRQLQDRTVRREYHALVWGTPNVSGTIDAPMARHPRDRIKMAVSRSITAKPARTHFQRVAQGQLEKFPVSLVLCRLETGRTHQIRVHMQSLGFPLVGDPLYGKAHLARFFARQALQARRLGLIHPVSGEVMEWEAPLAQDMQDLLHAAGIVQLAGIAPA